MMLHKQEFVFDIITVNNPGDEIVSQPGHAHQHVEILRDEIRLEMVYIPGGTFIMGSPNTEETRSERESPQHEVTVKPFYMGKYPMTQEQCQAIIGSHPSWFTGAKRPVEKISWYQAVEWCERLSEKSGHHYRLPSEAEWEYACRAETTTPFYVGETITPRLANYHGQSHDSSGVTPAYRRETTVVGSFPSNAFGLYDMSGNIWEWCADPWHENYINAPTDGSVWGVNGDTSYRVVRGGSWYYPSRYVRSASRGWYAPDDRLNALGFRVALLLS